MCYSKLSSLLNSPSHDVRTLFQCPTKSGCKDSANREKMQIFLRFSEVPPIFKACVASIKVVQTERKTKFLFRILLSNLGLKPCNYCSHFSLYKFHALLCHCLSLRPATFGSEMQPTFKATSLLQSPAFSSAVHYDRVLPKRQAHVS